MTMKGFDHGNRGLGVRDHQLILPSVVCSTRVSSRIAKEIGAITFAHQHGCGFIGNDVGRITDYFAALANHPNVSSTLVVGLGCETIQGNELADKLIHHLRMFNKKKKDDIWTDLIVKILMLYTTDS
jgi:altronate dehydratase